MIWKSIRIYILVLGMSSSHKLSISDSAVVSSSIYKLYNPPAGGKRTTYTTAWDIKFAPPFL